MQIDYKKINLYKDEGVVVLNNVINNHWLKKLQIGIQKNFLQILVNINVYMKKSNNKELFYDDYCNWKRIIEYKDFLFNSGIANIASSTHEFKKS